MQVKRKKSRRGVDFEQNPRDPGGKRRRKPYSPSTRGTTVMKSACRSKSLVSWGNKRETPWAIIGRHDIGVVDLPAGNREFSEQHQ